MPISKSVRIISINIIPWMVIITKYWYKYILIEHDVVLIYHAILSDFTVKTISYQEILL